jgi:hypothetical protein
MFDVDHLVQLGLTESLVSIWQVLLYVLLMVPCLLLGRAKLALLITYLFVYYLTFLVYWKGLIMTSPSLVPFGMFIFSGLAIVVLFVVGSYFGNRSSSGLPS